jgi:protein TonB
MFSIIEGSRTVHLAHHNSPYIRIMLLALLVHLLLFALTPQFSFTPYPNEKEKPITVVPPPIYDVPPPPKDNPMPVNTIIGMDNDGDDDVVIPPTMYNNADIMPTGVSCLNKRPSAEFYAFDEPPILIHFERPVYPEFARESGIEGLVQIKVVVDREGKVTDAVVLDSDVTLDMERSALKAARGCLFKPGKQRGKPVPVTVMIPFEFRLSDCR